MSALDTSRPAVAPLRQGFALDRRNAKLAGVCAGIGHYFGIDPLIVRVAFVAGTVLGLGSLILLIMVLGAAVVWRVRLRGARLNLATQLALVFTVLSTIGIVVQIVHTRHLDNVPAEARLPEGTSRPRLLLSVPQPR